MLFIFILTTHKQRSNTNHFYNVHEDSGLYACAKGCPTKELTRIRLDRPKQIEDELSIMREDFLLNHQSKMLVLVSMATGKMIRLVTIYHGVWFVDTTAGKLL